MSSRVDPVQTPKQLSVSPAKKAWVGGNSTTWQYIDPSSDLGSVTM